MSVSVPEFMANTGFYSFEWGTEGVRVSIDRLHDSKGTASGEVTVKYKPPESDDFQHLHQARLNLASTRERTALAKHLSSRVDILDWDAIIEQVSVKTLAKSREGEPVKMVGNQPINETAKYLNYPLLLNSQPNLLYGPGGTGKSTIAAMLALEVASSHDGNVLWLDFEWDEGEVNSLLKRLKDGMGIDPSLEIAYRFCHIPLADDIQSLQKMATETKAELVIVDSVGAACGGAPMAPDVVLRYFAALRSLKMTTLSLDHVAKENRGPFGSVYKVNAARNIWEVIKGNSDSTSLSVGLHQRKLNSGPSLKPIGYQFDYQDNAILPKRVDTRAIPEVLATMALADQMETALLRKSMTPAELAEELGKPITTIAPVLSRRKDRFVSLGGGKWGAKAMECSNDGNC